MSNNKKDSEWLRIQFCSLKWTRSGFLSSNDQIMIGFDYPEIYLKSNLSFTIYSNEVMISQVRKKQVGMHIYYLNPDPGPVSNGAITYRRFVLGDPEVTANIYCKSRNLPNTDTQNYSTELR